MIERAVEWAVGIANDDSHGYDQTHRQGPDYDCSSLVINAWKQAGVPLSCTYTGNMRADMLAYGFELVTDGSRRRGDVLLNDRNHTAMMVSDTMLVQAGSNEFGGITGGQTGDQTGKEIRIMPYYDFPWDCVLRYEEGGASAPEEQPTQADGVYTVKAGDSLWAIAERVFGDGLRYRDIMDRNGLDSANIHPGDVLVVADPGECESCKVPEETAEDVPEDGVYVVQYGDTLWSIAERFLGDGSRYDEIARANGIGSQDVNVLMVGQKLRIPI